ncbi:Aste57867_21463 [Aphanomyces stellatus]|uniref:Aste57867_21463 protein n=1 Tax=Aphanomyces stellatus TaxID=120398 RepID=A0A485LIZ6_9STRA|nr:hypothetical protein As57867_021394 [Aphanomyces stellatus]VFT98134.1 Aste57867_21463 [Aphanomyces stellatus]
MVESAPLVQPTASQPPPTRSPWTTSTKSVVAAAILAIVGTIAYLSLSSAGNKTVVAFTSSPNSESFGGDLRLRCNETYITQTLDHFTAHRATYQQRYYVCGEHWKYPDGPIFFFTGHESDADTFVQHTGLMWENAAEFGALLVFAEHRYFGKSFPKIANATFLDSLRFLSSEQALADYAVLVRHVKDTFNAEESPVIAFGGSYAGMLAAWFRMKYPHLVDGAIAASAPLLAFEGQDVDAESYARITTFVSTPEAGSAPNCVPNVRKAQAVIAKWGTTAAGRAQLVPTLGLCSTPPSEAVVLGIADGLMATFPILAEANYPFASSYFGGLPLPAFPNRVACDHLAADFTNDDAGLVRGFRAAVGVVLNATGNLPCIEWNAPAPRPEDQGLFMYLWCTELYMLINARDGTHDFFRPQVQNATADAETCRATWGVELRPQWAQTVYGGLDAIKASSNIVFSNGNFDPWGGYGVWESLSDSIVAVSIDQGAHHLDLMFNHDNDPVSVRQARAVELREIRKWVQARKDRYM